MDSNTKQALTQLLALQQQSISVLQALLTGMDISTEKVEVKAKKERKPRGSSGWDLFKKQVRKEMTDASPGEKFSLTQVADECKTRKEAGQYDEAHWKQLAAEQKSATASAMHTPAQSESEDASTNSKKRGRPKGSKNKDTTPNRPTKPASTNAPGRVAQNAAKNTENEDEAEVSPWTFKGKELFKTGDNEVWSNVNGAPGESVGVYNPLTNKIVKH